MYSDLFDYSESQMNLIFNWFFIIWNALGSYVGLNIATYCLPLVII